MGKTVLFIAMSLDGYIAKPGDDLRFLSIVEKAGEDYGYGDFISKTDTVVIGRKTYDWVMNEVKEFPHADKNTWVITRKPRPDEARIKYYTGDLNALIIKLKKENSSVIFIDGGAELVNALMKLDLIDEYIISIIPVFVGEGVRLFKDGRPEQSLKLIKSLEYETGLVKLHYLRNR